ncbi:MAG TPA: 6-phosphogluconolactonase [Spirochaetia bacterium]|nr:6-phosphogluconolactonase [Spirochaetia bacterium]
MEVETLAYPDAEALAEAASTLAAHEIETALRERGRAVTILAGGSTPRETYRLLSRGIRSKNMPASALVWLFGDERWVPVTDPQSNERMARESLLDPIHAPAATVISWDAGAGEPVDCAARYAARAQAAMGGQSADLVFLGVGADGHTASLFPDGTAHLTSGSCVEVGPTIPGFAAAVQSRSARGWRLTLCPNVLNSARIVVFLVAGEEKALALQRARAGDPATPAAWIRGRRTVFMVTRDTLGPESPAYGRDIRHA